MYRKNQKNKKANFKHAVISKDEMGKFGKEELKKRVKL